MTEKPLYEDKELIINNNPSCPEEHILIIGLSEEYPRYHLLQRGVLEQLARTPYGGIEEILKDVNPIILYNLKKERIPIDGLHVALCQAYAEEERRIGDFSRSRRS